MRAGRSAPLGSGRAAIIAALGALLAAFSCAHAADRGIEQITVIGIAPADVQSIDDTAIANAHALSLPDLLAANAPSAFVSDTESNPFQEDVYFHGFDASPVLGTAVGLALYQNGTRINERFGDTVLWALVPSFALHRIEVVAGSEPVYGLNALGGAVVLDMKTGFNTAAGTDADLSAGSFGRARLVVESAQQVGDEAFYIGVMIAHDGGWRRHSVSDVDQVYGDYSVRSGNASAGLSLTLANDFLNGNAAIPSDDFRSAAFSIPDTARDRLVFAQARSAYDASDTLHLHANAYLRSADLRTVNGQPLDFVPCSSDPALLCTGNDPADPLSDKSGASIAATTGAGGTLGMQATRINALGVSFEADIQGEVFGAANTLSAGATLDWAHTEFRSRTALGTLAFEPGGVTVDRLGIDLGGPRWNIALRTTNADEGLYAEDLLQVSPSVSLKLSARLNLDRIALTDRLGGSLSGTHGYSSLNPAATLSWQAGAGVTLFASAGQSSRTPTAAELSCADPLSPCLFPLSFISDPPLRKVVARTVTLGARGTRSGDAWSLDWDADAYVTRNGDDIIFVSSGPLIGSGYFTNVGATRRIGVDASLSATWQLFDVRLNYGFVDATFRSPFVELSAFNPGADANSEIHVVPGNDLPGIPRSTATVEAGFQATPRLHVGLDASLQSSRFLRGDEANLQAPLPGFFVLGIRADYRLSDTLTLYLVGTNILDRRYATFGLYGDPTAGGALPQFSNPRFIVPAAPVGVWAGIRAAL